ncbi:hypothetical protein [Microlunatus antarcticus]|uniref:Uncharacterized protein n=1 Tax=Microlunatus antarcticus TaxID=53388 RepID=A0A7W5JU44_9ACTN|nr:hypothetical protein [Microlunatus antarcticus]MBB3326370.1 hypothetical protein [Microlunatus antarcticus]
MREVVKSSWLVVGKRRVEEVFTLVVAGVECLLEVVGLRLPFEELFRGRQPTLEILDRGRGAVDETTSTGRNR